jgi:hypothetical protein
MQSIAISGFSEEAHQTEIVHSVAEMTETFEVADSKNPFAVTIERDCGFREHDRRFCPSPKIGHYHRNTHNDLGRFVNP